MITNSQNEANNLLMYIVAISAASLQRVGSRRIILGNRQIGSDQLVAVPEDATPT